VNKSERLLNLLILLLVQRHYISKERIRATVEAYRDSSDEAFERMFERDKDELRALGVPIELGSVDPLFDDEPGYRIRPDEFALPGIELTADEAAVVGLATRVWQHAGLAAHTSGAIAKLTAAGVEIDASRIDLAAPVVTVDDPNFDEFWQASLDKTVVVFDYQRSDSPEVMTRRLEPWGVVSYSGRWYVVGRDVDRGAERMFRLSRVRSSVRRVGRSGAFTVPEGTSLRELTNRLAPGPRTEVGTVLARTGSCLGLRRYARLLAEGVEGPDGTTDWDRLEVSFASHDQLAEDALAQGANAFVETPETVRAIVADRLRRAISAHTGGGAA
jgi:proteasome accessory factor B